MSQSLALWSHSRNSGDGGNSSRRRLATKASTASASSRSRDLLRFMVHFARLPNGTRAFSCSICEVHALKLQVSHALKLNFSRCRMPSTARGNAAWATIGLIGHVFVIFWIWHFVAVCSAHWQESYAAY